MPARVTDWGAAQYLKILHGLAPRPASYFIALCQDEPGVGIDGDLLAAFEPDPGLGYLRAEIPLDAASWSDPTIGGYLTNLIALEYGIPGGDWGLLNHFAACDSRLSGQVYCYGEFNRPARATADFDVQIPPGGLSFTAGSYEPAMVSF